ncbi:NAD(P)H-dependent oxidoreductase [Flavobacterium hydrophilum]|uniref:NAD(P)H dehydrogenase n=1 Tax=Flavobacterium hydrophilum TaxID=2211445 RepID=A0A2V4C7N6_9FLAO|nr:NAD(P)H-dependent oxidoreductase [Flavobacterium hydrophilum]PXY46103.1 NAD(P)H dehydrogenase [Flavobacterium hydrophilum]
MNILIVYCHPSKKSYTFQLFEHLKSLLEKHNLSFEVSDLYEMNFQGDMSETEYEREGFAKIELPIPQDVLEEHAKIEKADCIIFLYPVWWSDCPAKLKGWFDRVYSVGYAYGQNDTFHKMKILKLGLVICTAGHPNNFLTEIGIAQSIENVMLDDRLGKRFEHKEMLILGGTLELENVMQQHFLKIEESIHRIIKYCN